MLGQMAEIIINEQGVQLGRKYFQLFYKLDI